MTRSRWPWCGVKGSRTHRFARRAHAVHNGRGGLGAELFGNKGSRRYAMLSMVGNVKVHGVVNG